MMSADDLNMRRKGPMTLDELEDCHHDPSTETTPMFTPALRQWVLFGSSSASNADVCDIDGCKGSSRIRPVPKTVYCRAFERRPPALGATPELLTELKLHYARIPPVQQRSLYHSVHSKML